MVASPSLTGPPINGINANTLNSEDITQMKTQVVKSSRNGKSGPKVDSKTETKKQRRERLFSEREIAELELSRLRGQMQTEIEHDADEGDPDVYEREKLLAIIRTLEEKIESLAYALKALENGQYGTCERCGSEIGSERLKAMPGTTLCVKCKAATEKILRRGISQE
jgi:RNA polymerase-binding protein DksA